MLFPGFVVFRGAAHQAGGKLVGIEGRGRGPSGDLFDQVEKGAAIAVGHFDQLFAGGAVEGEGAVQVTLGALGEALKVGGS